MMYKLSIKNITQNPVRSFTLGFFVFFVCFMMVICNTCFETVSDNMEDALINTFTGHVLIRQDTGENTDLFSMDAKWNKNDKLSVEQVAQMEELIDKQDTVTSYGKRIRTNTMFSNGTKRMPSMIVGLDQDITEYKKSVKLVDGDYLDMSKKNQVILMEEQANSFKIEVGDTVTALYSVGDTYGEIELEVVGIGNMDLLSRFNFPAAFVSYETAVAMSSFEEGEASDIAVYLEEKDDSETVAEELLTKIENENLTLTTTSWKDLGGYIMNSIGIFKIAFNGFLGVLMVIVSILIINLIFMMGLERRQEIGTLKAIGFSRAQNIKIFLTEIVSVGAIGAFLGAGLSGGLIKIMSKHAICASYPVNYLLGDEFYIQFSFSQLAVSFVLMVVIVFIAALYPCFKISSLDPAETLQEV